MHGLQRRLLCAQWWIHVAGGSGQFDRNCDPAIAYQAWDQVQQIVQTGDAAALRWVVNVLGAAPTPYLRRTHGPELLRDLLDASEDPSISAKVLVLLLVLEDENVMRMLGLRERSNRASRSGESPGATAAE